MEDVLFPSTAYKELAEVLAPNARTDFLLLMVVNAPNAELLQIVL